MIRMRRVVMRVVGDVSFIQILFFLYICGVGFKLGNVITGNVITFVKIFFMNFDLDNNIKMIKINILQQVII